MKTYVLDTGVVVEAMRNPAGPCGEYLRGARRLELRLAANVALALEYEAQCTADEPRAAAGLSEGEAGVFASGVIAMMNPVETHRLWSPRLRDPTDELVLESAVNGLADAIVTFSPKDFQVASDRFGIEVIRPGR
jgi:predicted nucleic acid-binding protein